MMVQTWCLNLGKELLLPEDVCISCTQHMEKQPNGVSGFSERIAHAYDNILFTFFYPWISKSNVEYQL